MEAAYPQFSPVQVHFVDQLSYVAGMSDIYYYLSWGGVGWWDSIKSGNRPFHQTKLQPHKMRNPIELHISHNVAKSMGNDTSQLCGDF